MIMKIYPKKLTIRLGRSLFTISSDKNNWREQKLSVVSESSVNSDYFARTICATIINQLKVFDIILSIIKK